MKKLLSALPWICAVCVLDWDWQMVKAGGKIIMILSMYAGRVGIMTFVMALTARRREALIRYPEEKIIIG